MADRVNNFRARVSALPWWLKTILVWAATRVVSTVGFLVAAATQGPSYWYPFSSPSYFDYLNIWDVTWFEKISKIGSGPGTGYPFVLPLNEFGGVMQNPWAFMPGFPFLVRGISFLTGDLVPWKFLAPTTNLILSFALAIAIYKVFNVKFDTGTSLWGVAIFGLWCASPVLQAGYAESLGLLLLACSLYFLLLHRYLATLPFLIVLSVTRPGMIAFALALAGIWVVRYVQDHRAKTTNSPGKEFPIAERWKLIALIAVSGFLGLLWPIIAWIATGRIDAYTATELAWRSHDPHAQLQLMSGVLGAFASACGPILGPVLLALALAAGAWLMFTPSVKHLGYELRLWVGAYLFYLLLVLYPQSSTFRILMPAFPLAAALALKSRNWPIWLKALLVGVLIMFQFVWLAICWVYVEPDFTPP